VKKIGKKEKKRGIGIIKRWGKGELKGRERLHDIATTAAAMMIFRIAIDISETKLIR